MNKTLPMWLGLALVPLLLFSGCSSVEREVSAPNELLDGTSVTSAQKSDEQDDLEVELAEIEAEIDDLDLEADFPDIDAAEYDAIE